MPRTKAANARQYRYNEKHIKRVPLDVQKEYYDTILRPAAAAAGLPVNTYIKTAISEKIEKDFPGGVPASGADPE